MMAMTGIFLPDIVKENLWQNHLHSRHCIEYERRHEVCSDKQQLVETYFVSFTLLRSYKALSMTEHVESLSVQSGIQLIIFTLLGN